MVSGAVALLLQQRPDLTPDQVKAALRRAAQRLPRADAAGQGAGELDVARAAPRRMDAAARPRRGRASTGLGSLEAARGSVHIALDGVALVGEHDLFGAFDTAAWARASAAGTAWAGGRWMGRALTGDGWTRLVAGPARPGPGVTWSGRHLVRR